ncbi:MAG TPA: acyltransferase [Nevskiaceae bacterium]|nr:acyltransferase [Nevskiaceae bacterium]
MTHSASSSTGSTTAQGRLAGLDGLRGLAMLMVIAIHLSLFGAGWVGLSSFFVLSGFLITRILFDDIDGTDSLGECLKRFYIRRTLRVFPIYYLFLFAMLVLGAFVEVVRVQSRGELPWAFAYVYNLFLLTSKHHATHLFDHLWSLSVEEQFYLFWPLVVYFVGRRHLPIVLIAILIASPLARWATVQFWPPPIDLPWVTRDKVYFATYFSTLSHLDGFAFGALLNYMRVRPRVWWILASIAISYLIAVPVQGFGISPTWQYAPPLSLGYPLSMPRGYQWVWGYTVIYFNCALLIYTICHRNVVQAFFSHPLLDWLGKRSYAIYIIHYPLLFAMEPLLQSLYLWIGGRTAVLCFVPLYVPVVLASAHLIHQGIEKPILKLKDRFSTPRRKRAAEPQLDVAG